MGNDERYRFERSRLDLFAAHGFEGETEWLTDRAGRETYAIVRPGEPVPTVLVHGGVGSATEWVMMADRLEGHVVIPDRPGNGLGYPVDYREVEFRSDAARWLLELVDSLGVKKINLVGASMGGFFAIAFTTAYPERVRRLVLAGSSAGLVRELPLFLRLWANPVIGPLISRLRIRDAETLRKRVYAGYVAHPDRIPLDVLQVALAGLTLPGTSQATQTMLHALTTFSGVRPELLMEDDMARVRVPTLFVWGDRDRVATSEIGEDLVDRMDDARLVVIEDAGHIPHLDQPQAVAEAINSFLQMRDS